ncbi:hypothetical protein T07_4654 [Trichinella nelsoni]|uniref:Uncharacterized protein n=1 Tax=Trichinella nelsoni TaxID=6336 RepID=A0A0V0RAN1_9BILA|nr:hypothetical protein T07_4654 [Trichinella nelsoni]
MKFFKENLNKLADENSEHMTSLMTLLRCMRSMPTET